MAKLKISKKQNKLLNDIISENKQEIYVLGSTQSGKTFIICLALILYAQKLYKYNPDEEYAGAIIGWNINTIKSNIADVIIKFLDKMGLKKKNRKGIGDYEFCWGGTQEDNYLKIYNIKFSFFSFNNKLSFNSILGRPLVFVWVDESAKIYTQKQLQESFNQLPGRQVSYAEHPYLKTIHSFNVEGNENHDYKVEILDKKQDKTNYTFFPFDNPKISTPEAMQKVINMFPPGSLREQKIYNKWVIAEGKVFTKINIIDNLDNMQMREIGLGNDYGSVNPTTFVPIALCYNKTTNKWCLVRLPVYYHNPKINGDTPTTEYYSKQLRLFMLYLKEQYPFVPITTNVIDSEASHFDNRLSVDNIPHTLSKKGPGSVDSGVQHLQSLFYKDYMYILKGNSITHFTDEGEPIFSGKDESLIEFESYQYDSVKSVKEGVNCYKKELDHSIDGTRYIIAEWKETNRVPIV